MYELVTEDEQSKVNEKLYQINLPIFFGILENSIANVVHCKLAGKGEINYRVDFLPLWIVHDPES